MYHAPNCKNSYIQLWQLAKLGKSTIPLPLPSGTDIRTANNKENRTYAKLAWQDAATQAVLTYGKEPQRSKGNFAQVLKKIFH